MPTESEPGPRTEFQNVRHQVMRYRVMRYRLIRLLRLRGRRILAALGIGLLLIVWSSMRHRSRPAVRSKPMAVRLPVRTGPNPPGIVLHDSESPAKWHGVALNAARLEAIHAKEHPDWATTFNGKVYHIGYHYVILPDGAIEKGRPEGCLGMHARMYNDWIGICVIGGFSTNRHWWPERPTAAQERSIIKLCEYLMSKYHIPPDYVKRHRDINDTYCPGDRFPYFKILAVLKKYAATHPETRPLPGHVVSLAHPRRHQRKVYPSILGIPVKTHH